MAIYSIYRFTNLVNGKVYIGKSINVERRYQGHLNSVKRGSQNLIHRAIRTHGIENFKFEVIDTSASDPEAHNELERQYILEHDCCMLDGVEKGYNMTRGGDGMCSDSMRQLQQRLIASGKHCFAGKEASARLSARNKKAVEAGTHPWAGDNGRAIIAKRIAEGTHHFAGKAGSKLQKDRVENGTHPLHGEVGSKQSKEVQAKRIAEGTHHFVIERTCPYCGKTGKGPNMPRYHFDKCKLKP